MIAEISNLTISVGAHQQPCRRGTSAASRAANAGLLAVAILATARPELRAKLQKYRDDMAADVRQQRL
ncbi:MAG: hypothetical protein DMG03_29565 [Acidobacteria bacterium]|nr:MAG: hypothetical protein DMG03_29565 [Acidobacteriota bacterium]